MSVALSQQMRGDSVTLAAHNREHDGVSHSRRHWKFIPLSPNRLRESRVHGPQSNPRLAHACCEPPVEDRQQAAQERIAPSDERWASGRVVAVDRAGNRITLEYRPIPQLFLEGGTRIFNVGDPTSLKGLGPGDKVRFEVERDGRSYTITRLVNSN